MPVAAVPPGSCYGGRSAATAVPGKTAARVGSREQETDAGAHEAVARPGPGRPLLWSVLSRGDDGAVPPGDLGETWHRRCLPDAVGPQGRSGWLSLVVCVAHTVFPGVTAEGLLSPTWEPPAVQRPCQVWAHSWACAGLGAHADDCQVTGRSLLARAVLPGNRPVRSPHSCSCSCPGGCGRDRQAGLSGPPAPCPRSPGTPGRPLCLPSLLRASPCPGRGGTRPQPDSPGRWPESQVGFRRAHAAWIRGPLPCRREPETGLGLNMERPGVRPPREPVPDPV